MKLGMDIRFRSALSAFLCAAAFITVMARGQAQLSRQALHNHVRREVSSGQAALVGRLPAAQRMQLSIVLPLRNQTALTELIGRLYDPSSPDFHHFLSVNQFTQQFGPTAEDYQAVVDFAKANGFSVTDSAANRLIVPISGTAAQVEKAFNVRMNNYRHPTENREFFSPDREPTFNASVPVAHISGLNNFSIPRPALKKSSGANVTSAETGSGPDGYFLPSDMRAAYYSGGDLNGSGQAIGLFEFDGGYSISDVTGSFAGTAAAITNEITMYWLTRRAQAELRITCLSIMCCWTVRAGLRLLATTSNRYWISRKRSEWRPGWLRFAFISGRTISTF
jgi:Pro-kumamolisin, activation domain